MAKLDESVFEHISANEEVKRVLNNLAGFYSEKYRKIIIATYEDLDLRSLYNAIREENTLGFHKKSKSHRQIIKFPNLYVLHFLHDYLSPKYGENWLKDKEILYKVMRNEELIKPWLTFKMKTLASRSKEKK